MLNVSLSMISVLSMKFNSISKYLLHLPSSHKTKLCPMFLNLDSPILVSKSKMLWAILEIFPKKNSSILSINNFKNLKTLHKIWKREFKTSDFRTDSTKSIKQHLRFFSRNSYLILLHLKSSLHYFGFFTYI